MPLILVRNDITRMCVDAIINAANKSLRGGGGVDGAIHRAAGPELLEECKKLGGCAVGEAKITGAYALPAKYVIHTVGPKWMGGVFGERRKLAECYRNSLETAYRYGCETVAFPLISSGAYRFPKDDALNIATDTIRTFLDEHEMTVYLVVFDKESVGFCEDKYPGLRQFIDDKYSEVSYRRRREGALEDEYDFSRSMTDDELRVDWSSETDGYEEISEFSVKNAADDAGDGYYGSQMAAPTTVAPCYSAPPEKSVGEDTKKGKKQKEKKKGIFRSAAASSPLGKASDSIPAPCVSPNAEAAGIPKMMPVAAGLTGGSLEDKLKCLDESFSELLLRKIDEANMTDVECYKRANIDRKLFNKIKNDKNYRPSKPTVLAFAVALRLNIDDAREFLARAGFAFSGASKFDIIIEYFITGGIYDIFEINNVLFEYDQCLLGNVA